MKKKSFLLSCLLIIVFILSLNNIPVRCQKISIANPTIDFGTLLQGSYPDASLTFSIQNTGTSTLRIDGIGGLSGPFHIATTFPINISAGSSAPITIHVNRNYT